MKNEELYEINPNLEVLPGGISEVAKRLGRSPKPIYKLAYANKLTFVIKLGGSYVVPRIRFERYLREYKNNGK